MWRLKGNLMHICVKNDFLTIVVWNMKKVGFRNNYIDLYLKSRRGAIGKYIQCVHKVWKRSISLRENYFWR